MQLRQPLCGKDCRGLVHGFSRDSLESLCRFCVTVTQALALSSGPRALQIFNEHLKWCSCQAQK
jgi:hypothetical protein